MSRLIQKERDFLRLLLTTSSKQQVALIKTIQPMQMKAVVQVVYNVLIGNRELSSTNKNKLNRYRLVIRRFVGKGLAHERRKKLLLKYFDSISLMLKVIQTEV